MTQFAKMKKYHVSAAHNTNGVIVIFTKCAPAPLVIILFYLFVCFFVEKDDARFSWSSGSADAGERAVETRDAGPVGGDEGELGEGRHAQGQPTNLPPPLPRFPHVLFVLSRKTETNKSCTSNILVFLSPERTGWCRAVIFVVVWSGGVVGGAYLSVVAMWRPRFP